MALQFSTTLRNAWLDDIETTAGTSAKIMLYNGALPSNCATADTALKIAEFDLGSDWAAAASNGRKSLSDTPLSTSTLAAATIGHFRLYAEDGSTCHMQGLCGQTWTASTLVIVGQQVVNGGNVYRCITSGATATSGGPTGTSAGIADGTAVWAYAGTADLVLDNSDVISGQTVSIISFALIAPGA